jgi:hypothetical protein
MLPDSVLSTTSISADFKFPRNIPRTDTVDYEQGGVDFNDPSEGLEIKTWRGTLDTDTGEITLETIGVTPEVRFTAVGAIRFSFTFDQNMNPFIGWDTETTAHFWWYDGAVSDYVLTTLPAGSQYVTVGIDDHRDMQTGNSDIIVAYLREGTLYFRAQRDRYEVEYTLQSGLEDYTLRQVGMNEKLRFQFQLVPR